MPRFDGEESMACYVHDLPGRMRLKIPAMKRNAQVANKIRNLLEQLHGVSSTVVNLVTGSIVIHFDANRISSRDILGHLARRGFVDPGKCLSSEEYISRALSQVGQYLSRAAFGVALDSALSNTSLSFLAVLV
jgi:copper chaperone CopZ